MTTHNSYEIETLIAAGVNPVIAFAAAQDQKANMAHSGLVHRQNPVPMKILATIIFFLGLLLGYAYTMTRNAPAPVADQPATGVDWKKGAMLLKRTIETTPPEKYTVAMGVAYRACEVYLMDRINVEQLQYILGNCDRHPDAPLSNGVLTVLASCQD